MVVVARKDSETKVSLSFFFVCGLDFRKEHFPMPKTLPQRIVFTIVMATIMVYGMIVYNVALNTGGVTNATFGMALHEMPIMVPVAFVLEFFVVEKLATALAFTFMRPTDRPQFITYAISLMIVCIMCSYELVAYLAVQGAQLWHMGAYLGLQLPYGALLADVLLRPAQPVYLPRYFPQTAASGKAGTALKQIQHAARTNRQRAFFIVLHPLQNFLNKFPAFA